MRAMVGLVVFAGCGRLGFDTVTSFDGAGADGTSAGGDASGALGDALDTAGACPLPNVTDTFADGVLDPTWTGTIDPKIALSETGSHMVFSFGSPATSGSSTTFTSPVVDLDMRCVTLTVASIRGVGNSTTGIEIGTPAARIRVQVVGSLLSAIDLPFTGLPPTFTFDPVVHARWRVQLGGGHVVAIALDSNGNPTELLRDLPAFFDATSAQIMLYSSVTSGNVSGGTAELDAIEY